jgi:hypothetical protein
MLIRALSVSLLALAVVVFTGQSTADEKKAEDKNTHEGTFVSAKDKEFTMADKSGKEHTHTIGADVKIVGEDGKDAKLADFKKGQKIKVTTKEGDAKTVTKIEAVKSTEK